MKALVILAALVVGAYLGYKIVYPTYTYRFRLTLEVDVEGKTKSASSVIEVKTTLQPTLGGLVSTPIITTVRGEAVFLDLGGGRNLIGLLTYGNGDGLHSIEFLVPWAFSVMQQQPATLLYARHFAGASGRRELYGDLIPTLLTFTDLGDPSTARLVWPGEFERVFGPGTRFRMARVELTTDAVTKGALTVRLPWASRFVGRLGKPSEQIWSELSIGRVIDAFTRGI